MYFNVVQFYWPITSLSFIVPENQIQSKVVDFQILTDEINNQYKINKQRHVFDAIK